jgi:putative ABC transport system permease protein
MRLIDLVILIFENLGRRKARVALTAIGVVIGTSAVVVLISLAIGLQRSAQERLWGISDLSQIQVYPNYGEGGGPVQVISGGGGSQSPPTQKLLTNDAIDEMKNLPGVAAVIPRDYTYGEAMLKYNRLESWAGFTGIGLTDLSIFGWNAKQGDLSLERGTVVIGSNVPMNFYDPLYRGGDSPPPPPELYDQQLRLILTKYDQEGNPIRRTVMLRVGGIIAETRGEADWSMYMNLDELNGYNEWFTGRRVNRNKDGYNQITVIVNDPKKVLEINDLITNIGYQTYTVSSYVQGINSFFIILQVVFGGVGAIALLVAAIGIANTMAMAILERTREIGLMKAVGATNRDVLSVFLGEAAGIGFIGGLGGILIGWSAAQLLNVLAIVYFAGQSSQQGGTPPPSSAAYTPAWLLIFALVFAILVGVISGLYPALRAATLVPVNALKYE